MQMNLEIAWLYPDLMSTYGDRGNIMILKKRCEWREIEVHVEEITLETPVSKLKKCDLLFMGGAQDRQQKIAGSDFLRNKGPVIKEMVEQGTPALFVCAAYQAVGHFYQPYQGDPIAGPGIFDLYTVHPGDQAKRLIGNDVAELVCLQFAAGSSQLRNKIVGFENHGGRTYLNQKSKIPAKRDLAPQDKIQNEKTPDQIRPLARVIKGYGNNGEDGYEGALYKNAIGSYFHGPLLPKNPQIADWLISKTLEVKYHKQINLQELDDQLEWQAHQFMHSK